MDNKIIVIDVDGEILEFDTRSEFKQFLQDRATDADEWGDPAPDFEDLRVIIGREINMNIQTKTKVKVKPLDDMLEDADLWESIPKNHSSDRFRL